MKKKYIAIIIIFIAVILFILTIVGANNLLTDFIENSNVVCKDQAFTSPDEAIQAMEASNRKTNDTSLDYCPPYKLRHTFDYDENTIVFYSYCDSSDCEETNSYAVRVLKHNEDETMSFDGGFAEFLLREPNGRENYYYFTNIETNKGSKSISFLYLPKGSDKDIYVDGIKAEKILVTEEDRQFYICYAISNRDTFLTNLITSISIRHTVEIK